MTRLHLRARRRKIGFTTRASCLLAAGLTAVICGLVLGETDLLRAGVLVVAIPVVAAVVVHRSRVRITSRRSVEPRQAAAGQAVTVALTVGNRGALPSGTLLLEDHLPDRFTSRARFVLDSLGRGQERTVSYRLPELSRGRYQVGPLRVRRGDPFRMVEVTRSFTATTEFLVYPVIDELPPGNPQRSDELGDGGGSHSVGAHGADDASTREYRVGDDLRKIHWRSSARLGSLMVRQEERPWRSQSTLLLDQRASAHLAAPREPGRDPRETDSFEWAVSAAASIAMQTLRGGREVDLLGDPNLAGALRFGDRERLATHFARVQTVPTAGLDALAGAVRSAARDSALVAVLGALDPDAVRLLAEAHPRGRTTPAFALLLDVSTWQSGDAAVDDAAAAAAILSNSGWRTVVVSNGMSTAQAWRLLLAGQFAGAAAVAR